MGQLGTAQYSIILHEQFENEHVNYLRESTTSKKNTFINVIIIITIYKMVVYKTIRISERLRDFLDKNITRKGQTYEDIIWNMLGLKTLTKEQKEDIKADYEKVL